LQAVFAGVDRGDRLIETPSAAAARQRITASRDAVAEKLKALTARVEALADPRLMAIDAELKDLRRDLTGAPRPTVQASSPSNGYHSAIHSEAEALAWVQVDMGRSEPIDEIRLVPARPTD